MEPRNFNFFERLPYFISAVRQGPTATAEIKGSPEYPSIIGRTDFYQMANGVLVSAQVSGLPPSDEVCKKRIFAFHIHSGGSCTGNRDDAFADALAHFNPYGCEHPDHAGDLPPLWGNNDGYAFEMFLTDRFSASQIIGKTLIVHLNADDFTTQPSGNAGQKIACGEIERYRSCRFSRKC